MFLYVWFDSVGYSEYEPTPEDHASIDAGNLMVIQIKGTNLPPYIWGEGKEVPKCQIEKTPDGDLYHYVP